MKEKIIELSMAVTIVILGLLAFLSSFAIYTVRLLILLISIYIIAIAIYIAIQYKKIGEQ